MERSLKELVEGARRRISSLKSEEGPKKTYKCRDCSDTGVLIIDRDFARVCPCVDQEIRERKLQGLRDFARIAGRFRQLRPEDFRTDIYQDPVRPSHIKDFCLTYIRNYSQARKSGKGLYFYSRTPGTGKTRMAISIGNALMDQEDLSLRYMTMGDFIGQVKASFQDKSPGQAQLEDLVRQVDLLILDDLGTENITAWSEGLLYSILDYRNDNLKPTILTSNSSIGGLAYGERIKSRLRRMALEIHFPEESIRDGLSRLEAESFLDQLDQGK